MPTIEAKYDIGDRVRMKPLNADCIGTVRTIVVDRFAEIAYIVEWSANSEIFERRFYEHELTHYPKRESLCESELPFVPSSCCSVVPRSPKLGRCEVLPAE